MKKLLLTIAIAALTSFGASAQKAGFINTDSVLVSMPEYVQAQSQIKTRSAAFQTELENDLKKIETLYNKYQQQKQYLTSSSCAAKEQEIISLESDLKKKQDSYFGTEGEMTSYSEKLLAPVRAKVDAAVAAYAAANGYGYIVDLAIATGVVYYNPSDDITNAIIEKLK